jgi:ketosteroid isomerase-like protein
MPAVDSIIADSASFFEDGRAATGWATYRDRTLIPQLDELTQRRLRFENLRVRLAGSTAWATASYALEALRDGEPVSRSGIATVVFRKRGGDWRLVHVHSSQTATTAEGSS